VTPRSRAPSTFSATAGRASCSATSAPVLPASASSREAGLITRTVAEGPPLSTAYALTEAGRALIPALAQISRWAEDYLPEP
jgi:hypothetical protein